MFRRRVLGSRPRPVPLLQILHPWTNVRGEVQSIRGVSPACLKAHVLGLFFKNLKAAPSCTCKYVIVVVCFPEDVGLKRNGSDSINNWGAIRDNWKSYFFTIVKSKSKTALKVAYLTNEYHTGSVLGRKNLQEMSSDVFLYIFIWHHQTFIHEGNRSNWFRYQVLDGSSAGILQKGLRSERQWNNVIKTRTKHQLTGDEWQQMNALMWRNCIKTQTLACSALIRLLDQCLWTVDYPWRAQGGEQRAI